jgi:hypothetical protein
MANPKADTPARPLTDAEIQAQIAARQKARIAAVLHAFLDNGLVPVARAQVPAQPCPVTIIVSPTLGEMSPDDRADVERQLAALER